MSKSAKLESQTRTTAMDDYRCWAQIATEFLIEIREHLNENKTQSSKQLVSRIDYFLMHDKLPPLSN